MPRLFGGFLTYLCRANSTLKKRLKRMFKAKWWIKSYLKQPIATLGNVFSLADHNYSGSLGYV